MAEVRNTVAMTAAKMKSSQALVVAHTANAAIMTKTLPMASLREHSQTERTLASPSLWGWSTPAARGSADDFARPGTLFRVRGRYVARECHPCNHTN